jgi:hypothetical protein
MISESAARAGGRAKDPHQRRQGGRNTPLAGSNESPALAAAAAAAAAASAAPRLRQSLGRATGTPPYTLHWSRRERGHLYLAPCFTRTPPPLLQAMHPLALRVHTCTHTHSRGRKYAAFACATRRVDRFALSTCRTLSSFRTATAERNIAVCRRAHCRRQAASQSLAIRQRDTASNTPHNNVGIAF